MAEFNNTATPYPDLGVLLVIGMAAGVFIRTSTRSNRTKEKRLVRRSEFFRDPSHKCVPLTEQPEQTERNKNTPITYSQNTQAGWLGSLKFSFEDNLLHDLFGKHYAKNEIIPTKSPSIFLQRR